MSFKESAGLNPKRGRLLLTLFTAFLLLSFVQTAAAQDSYPKSTQDAQWKGYRQIHFQVAQRNAYVVIPEKEAAGRPWVWRARFPNFHTEVDEGLLKHGFHIAYVDVSNLFGAPKAMEIGDAFYESLTEQYGFSPKPMMEGVSRGGLFVYNWAVRNPDRVSCIYCDTPVCDIKSWPAGKGSGLGSPETWKNCLKAYGMTEEQALAYDGNPVDQAANIARSGIPLLHLVSENDQVVPPKENTYQLKERLELKGGTMEVISVAEGSKASHGHHMVPPDPQRVVDFAIKHVQIAPGRRAMIREAKTILFLGDSITYSGQYVAAFDLWVRAQGWESTPKIINMGLPSETVSALSEQGHAGGRFPRPDLAERLRRTLEFTKPDLVFACYGINCGIYQPLDAERFKAFQNGIHHLRNEADRIGAKVIHVTPPTYDDQRAARAWKYNEVMEEYSNWLSSKTGEGWEVIDLHSAMAKALDRGRKDDPEFTFQPDAVHPNEQGHWAIATCLFDWFGDVKSANHKRQLDFLSQNRLREGLAPLFSNRMTTLRDAYLSEVGHLRPGLRKGKPMVEAEIRAREITESIEKILAEDGVNTTSGASKDR